MFYQPLTGVVKHLIILNALMFFGSYVLLGSETWDFMTNDYDQLGRLSLALFMPGSAYFQPYQIATHMFMHANIGHLAFNMLSLYIFGPRIEWVLGARRFLFYYLFCGLGAMVMHLGVQWWALEQAGLDPRSWNGSMLGASGAIFGILAAYAYLFPDDIIQLLFPPIAMKAKYFVPIMAALELYLGTRGYQTGVAHFAHLGGALFGFLLILYWHKRRFR
ncbi:MAG: rhomboid family intramembrane serine protease [Saprospiraceae bacterium]|nr:rhomboid family intramembrane serine protease [Saprospiraceae bacterium]MDW8483776.1 rhomboid family intramembrane serine protease [Saprospiraceae bacterium]